MKQGDLVIRKSYGGDVLFRIEGFTDRRALLRGVEYRLLADAPFTDIEKAGTAHQAEREQAMEMRASATIEHIAELRRTQLGRKPNRETGKRSYTHYFEVPGKVLHLDGDPNYLRKSMALYGELRVPAEGFYVQEANMPDALYRLLPQVKPDVVVVTGHDGLLKDRRGDDIYSLSSYKNSHNFVNAVKIARQYERNKDTLIVIAGACQSHFEALLQAGANFASSPARVLIHALDPLYIAAKTAFTSIRETVHMGDVMHHTYSGLEGLGGIETRGCYRVGMPRPITSDKHN